MLLEASLLELSESTAEWAAGVKQRVYTAAKDDIDTVAETLLRTVAGDATWEGYPPPVKQMLTANGPAIVAELRGCFLDVSAEDLGAIAQPTLLVAAEDSPPAFAEVTRVMAEALPSTRLEWTKGGHLVDVADPVVLRFVDEMLGDAGVRRN